MNRTPPDAHSRQARLPLTDGEQWAADSLTALRSARFAPPAIVRFLGESFDRAAETRACRPGLAGPAQLWSLTGTGAVLVIRKAVHHRRGAGAPSRRALLAWCAVEAAMLDWHLGMVQEQQGEFRARLSTADALTLWRSALAPFAAAAPPDGPWFMLLLALAGASDRLDGQFARRMGPTRFGRDFDTLADLVFRAAAIRGAARAGWIPPPPVRALLARQLLLTTGAAWHWFAHSHRPPLDTARLARWDAPPLLAGLALALAEARTRFSRGASAAPPRPSAPRSWRHARRRQHR